MFNQNNPLMQKWQLLSQREQSLLLVMAVALFGLLINVLIWSPMQAAKQEAQQSLQNSQQQWQWLNEQIPAWQTLKSPRASGEKIRSQNELMAQLQATLRQQMLQNSLKSMSLSQKGVKVSFKEVDAKQFFIWLQRSEQKGIQLRSLQVEPVEKEGYIKADLEWSLAQ